MHRLAVLLIAAVGTAAACALYFDLRQRDFNAIREIFVTESSDRTGALQIRAGNVVQSA